MTNIGTNCINYSDIQRIGGGTFGTVYRAKNKKTLHYVAIKEIDKHRLPKEQIVREIEMMNKMKNENSICIKDTIDSTDYFYIIMDLCGFNLEEHLKMRETSVSIDEIRYIFLQLNNVFKIMKANNLVHRDLKTSNILIANQRLDKSTIKLSDYGSSREVGGTKTFSGTLTTIAPEIINDEDDISKCDLWSIGVIIYYMCFKEYPYSGKNEHKLFLEIKSGKKLNTIENDELNDLVKKLLVMNVKERISWDEYFNHPFFKSNDESIEKLKQKIKLLENELKVNKYNNIENIDNESKNNLYTLSNHVDWITCLTILKDGRLASGSEDNSIIIYNKGTYQPDIIINEHKDCVNCLIQLKNGILASCSDDNTIKLFKIQEMNYEIIQTLNLHSNYVNKIIELSNDSLISGSSDSSIIFYNKDNLKYVKDYLISTSGSVKNIIQTKQNEIAYSTGDKKLNFYDLNEKKNKTFLENIISSFSSFLMINKDLLLVTGENKINIINVNDYVKIREIDILNAGEIRGVCRLNSNIIITGDDNGTLTEWKIEGDNLINSKNEKAHEDNITVVINLDDRHIVSGSYDDQIKIWKFDSK